MCCAPGFAAGRAWLWLLETAMLRRDVRCVNECVRNPWTLLRARYRWPGDYEEEDYPVELQTIDTKLVEFKY